MKLLEKVKFVTSFSLGNFALVLLGMPNVFLIIL